MSYNAPRRSDYTSELLVRYGDFLRILPNMLKADNFHTFIIWFEKLYVIEKRCLRIFLRKNKDMFVGEKKEWLDKIQRYYKGGV
ncbi:MAG: hypothetical protein LBK56_05655 [Gracilibacteraceae bacterium]|nr:hypothetical protein [Gracilibacteraceae bacterium]